MKCTCPECNLTFEPRTASATIMCPICDTQFPSPAGSIQSAPSAMPVALPLELHAADDNPVAAPSNKRQMLVGIGLVMGLIYLIGGAALAVYLLKPDKKPEPTPALLSKAAQALPPAGPAAPAPPPVGLPLKAEGAGTSDPAAGGDQTWESKLKFLRSNGLDIVIVFDSTGSMGGEIEQLKKKIHRIGSTLLELVPSARLSVCTYRDFGDAYVVKGLPLTNDIRAIERYLKPIGASGGGDDPEAVQEGLRWALDPKNNQFRKEAAKVILLFGDAPPHKEDQGTCEKYAADFHKSQQGIVSTVTCRQRIKLPEFVKISEAGGGESFLVSEPRLIVEQLVVLVFGSAHRDKVLEAFRLLEK